MNDYSLLEFKLNIHFSVELNALGLTCVCDCVCCFFWQVYQAFTRGISN